jgi:DNA replicative helicase MCM subunit Mcm2 (Cdc46/Mcm family)
LDSGPGAGYRDDKGINEYQAITKNQRADPSNAIEALRNGALYVLLEVQPDYAEEIKNHLRVAIRGVFHEVDISRITDEHVGKLVQVSGIVFSRSDPCRYAIEAQYICGEGHKIRVRSKGASHYKPKQCEWPDCSAKHLTLFDLRDIWLPS